MSVCVFNLCFALKCCLVPCVQCVDSSTGQDCASLKRVAVVEDFFDIIYAMHVEISSDPSKTPKHAGQKKTYKAVSCLLGLLSLSLFIVLLLLFLSAFRFFQLFSLVFLSCFS